MLRFRRYWENKKARVVKNTRCNCQILLLQLITYTANTQFQFSLCVYRTAFHIFSLNFFKKIVLLTWLCARVIWNISGESIQWWTEEHGGFEYRLAGSFTEWIMAIFMIIFTVSFTNEFKTLEYKEICFECRLPDYNPW